MSLLDDLEKKDYATLLNEALANVPDEVDKRVGSIIYDTLAPACMLLSEAYADLVQFYQDANVLTATGEALDKHGLVYGISRVLETASIYVFSLTNLDAGTTTEDTVGTSYQDSLTGVVYTITSAVNSVQVLAEAQTPGASTSITTLIPLDTEVVVDSWFIQQYGSDLESDDSYRARILNYLRGGAFPGSLPAYKSLYKSVMKPGMSRIYPVDLSVSNDLKVFCLSNAMTLLSANEKASLTSVLMGTGPLMFNPILTNPTIKNMTVVVTGSGMETFTSYNSLIGAVVLKYLKEEIAPAWDRTVGYGIPFDDVTIDAARIKSLLYSIPGINNIVSVTLTVGGVTGLASYDLALSSASCEWVTLSAITTIAG